MSVALLETQLWITTKFTGVLTVNLIITHKNSDFDALAAVVAASKLYPDSVIVMPEPLQSNVRSFVNLYRDLLPLGDPRDLENEKIDMAVVVDTNRRERLGQWQSLLEKSAAITVYDHHPGEDDFNADRRFIDAVGATTTILLGELRKRKIDFTDFEATLFALGIYEDTGCLTYDISTARDAEAVAYLWRKGISITMIQEFLRSPLNETQKELLERLIRGSQMLQINRRRVLIAAAVFEEYVVGAAALIQLLDEIENAAVTVIIVKMVDNIYLAARARDSDLNLLELFEPFAARGYPGVISAHFKGSELAPIKEVITELLKQKLPPAITAREAASKPVITINSEMSLAEADTLLIAKNIKGCPVVDAGEMVGMISRRDLQKGLRSELGHAPVKGFMKKPITADPGESLAELRRLMIEHNIGRVPIIDAKGDPVGIVTRSDILRHLSYLDRQGRSLLREKKSVSGPFMPGDIDDWPESGSRFNLSHLMESELPPRIRELVIQVGRQADRDNLQVYLVGGIIRDLLLRYPPEKDLDFVVIGDAAAFTYHLQKLFGGTVRHHDKFGTASLQLGDGLRMDLVTARREFYPSPAALPHVESSSLKDDLFRRDFTINTMACSLAAEDYGRLFDYYNGRIDLREKVIRALNRLSFIDDPLRILRAVRFEERFNFSIEPETLALIADAVRRRVLEKVTRQRLNQELRQIYDEPSPLMILRRFDDLKILEFLYPGVEPDGKNWSALAGIEEIIRWARKREWGRDLELEPAYLSGLLFGLEYTQRSAIINELHLSRDKASAVNTACREAPKTLKQLGEEELSPSRVVGLLEPLPIEALFLVYALARSGFIRDHLKLYMEGLRYIRPKLKGRDLMNLGLEPGPRYRKIIDSLKQAVLDGEVRTPREEIAYVLRDLNAGEGKEGDV